MRRAFGILLPTLIIGMATLSSAGNFQSGGVVYPPPPPPPPQAPGYQLGQYPWAAQFPMNGYATTDVRRMAYMAYQFQQDMQDFMRNNPNPSLQMREVANAVDLLAREAYDLDQEAARYPGMMQAWSDEYFALVNVFTNIGHMLASLSLQAPAEMLQEWNDVDFCMGLVDMQFARYNNVSCPRGWVPGRFNGGVWAHPWWGPNWWGYRHGGWHHGRWGHPGWGWTGGWRRPRWGHGGGWRHPGFGGGGHGGGHGGGGGWGGGHGGGHGGGGGWHHGGPRR